MSRFANPPLAVRLATAFGLQAVALLAGTDVRAVSLAGEVGQSVQAIGRLAADELYVRGGEREAIAALRRETQADVEQLSRLVGSDPNLVRFTGQLGPWNAALTKALTLDRAAARALYRAGIAPEMDGLQETMVALQRSVEDHTEATAAAVEADGRAHARVLRIVFVVSLLVAIAFALLITRSVVKPVREPMARLRSLDEHCLTELTAGLEAAAAGDFTREATPVTTPLAVRADDELGRLTTTFNSMLGKAQRSLEACTRASRPSSRRARRSCASTPPSRASAPRSPRSPPPSSGSAPGPRAMSARSPPSPSSPPLPSSRSPPPRRRSPPAPPTSPAPDELDALVRRFKVRV